MFETLVISGELELAETDQGFLPCWIGVDGEALDMIIAEHAKLKYPNDTRLHALRDQISHVLGPVQITIKPISIVDQYGEAVPDDLVLMPHYSDVSIEDMSSIHNAPWYEIGGYLFIPHTALDLTPAEGEPCDFGIDLHDPDTEILRIADALKRSNEIDGFYHA